MEREDILKFTNSIILISKLFTIVEDRFLKQKLHEKLSDLVFMFMKQQEMSPEHKFNNVISVAKPDDITQCECVAQCRSRDLLNSINNLLDYLEYLAHISENNTTPLLVAERSLLRLKLHILRKSNVVKRAKGVSEMSFKSNIVSTKSDIPRPSNVVNSVIGKQRPTSLAQHKKNFSTGTTNKERIFNYIKKMSDVRAKDIMREFSALSDRTVKRCLKELTDDGLLKKRSDGAAVYYLATVTD